MTEEARIEKEIDAKIAKLEERISAGEFVLNQCKRQLKNLKKQVKEYERLKADLVSSNAADGDL